MDATEPRPFPVIREAVASFPDREHFRRAVSALLAAGFDQTDLSVLASHQPLAVADDEPGKLIAAGIDRGTEIYRSAHRGRLCAAVGRTDRGDGRGAGRSRARRRGAEGNFDDYTAPPHRDEFAAALSAGAVLLWVRCADPDLEARALRILDELGGRHVHVHGRPERTEDMD